jgi:hypothetical protein
VPLSYRIELGQLAIRLGGLLGGVLRIERDLRIEFFGFE